MTRPTDPDEVDARLDALRARLLVGAPLDRLVDLPDRVRRSVELAADVGAPGLSAVDAATAALDAERARSRAIGVATAQARAVTGMLALLPVLGVLGLGALLDRPLWRFYLTPPGAAVGAAALTWLAIGVGVAVLIVRRATRPGPLSGLDEVYDLVATALSGGLPPGEALRAAGRHRPDHATHLARLGLALEVGAPPGLPEGLARLGTTLETALAWGAPAAGALRRVATDLRAEDQARLLAAAERLPALLTFPTALCLLPATTVLTGAPLVADGVVLAGT